MDTNDTLNDSLAIASLVATLLPTLVTLYDKIVANNQNAGLTPAATLLADVLTISSQMEQTAATEIAAAGQ